MIQIIDVGLFHELCSTPVIFNTKEMHAMRCDMTNVNI